jgi:hypothetical protein
VRSLAPIAGVVALALLAGHSWRGSAVAAAIDPRQGVVFMADAAKVRKAAESALRDAHYTVRRERAGRVVSGVWRRPARTTKEQAAAIEELRRISRYDTVDVPDTRALTEYRVTVRIEIAEESEGKTRVEIHAETVTTNHTREGNQVVIQRVPFASLGVLEEETLLRMREHLGEASAP